ncbi:MAG TPA: hypothetical protein VLT33_07475 [Labilithrix sp.]|nr:hypothetical protein [Labilithrix sp.]
MLWKWLTVVALAMTPALVLGQSAAAAAGIGWHLDPRVLVPVMAIAGFAEGMLVAWLGGTTTRVAFLRRWCERVRTPKAVTIANRWGTWAGMTLGVAALGQEPILLALRWLGVDLRKLLLPVAVSNLLFAAIYYAVVRFGLETLLATPL